ncbi:hypothetical protein [Longimicrobium sp.]|uniref:hypothetical protein n=1 Tax=Longimicrobium sp. TaxID=2029185 RepID=UPI003B39FBC5
MSRHPLAASIGLPYPPYLWNVVRRSAGMWLLARIAYVVVFMAGAAFLGALSPAEVIALVLHPLWTMRVVLVVLAAIAVWWDRRRAHELLLHANLGTWPGWFWTASLLTALVLDVVLQAPLAAL